MPEGMLRCRPLSTRLAALRGIRSRAVQIIRRRGCLSGPWSGRRREAISPFSRRRAGGRPMPTPKSAAGAAMEDLGPMSLNVGFIR
jgi:hypothetical protein